MNKIATRSLLGLLQEHLKILCFVSLINISLPSAYLQSIKALKRIC